MAGEENQNDEPLTCPQCGGRAISVTLSKGGVLKLVCASCHNPIGYSSDLMRVLVKPS
jgi:transcription elongation factor Elf1